MVLCCITVKYRVIKLFWNTSSRSYVNEFKTNGLQFWLGLSLANLAEGQTVLAWNRVRAIFLHPVTHAGQCSSTRTLLPQTDRATHYVSRSPINATQLYRNRCTYNRSTTKVVLLLLSDDKDGVTIREYLSAMILAHCGISRCAMLVIQPLPPVHPRVSDFPSIRMLAWAAYVCQQRLLDCFQRTLSQFSLLVLNFLTNCCLPHYSEAVKSCYRLTFHCQNSAKVNESTEFKL